MAKHHVIQHLQGRVVGGERGRGGHLKGQKEIPKSAHKPLGAAKEDTALCGEAGGGTDVWQCSLEGPQHPNSTKPQKLWMCLGGRWCLLSLSSQECWYCQWKQQKQVFSGLHLNKSSHIYSL